MLRLISHAGDGSVIFAVFGRSAEALNEPSVSTIAAIRSLTQNVQSKSAVIAMPLSSPVGAFIPQQSDRVNETKNECSPDPKKLVSRDNGASAVEPVGQKIRSKRR
jgi:hypothetical protein